MSDWNKFNAIVRDKRKRPRHSPPVFPVIVWGVTIETARDKLVGEYPAKHYVIESLDPVPVCKCGYPVTPCDKNKHDYGHDCVEANLPR